ncbi:DUF4214 domain-containing protein [Sphingomonas glacialis]|uniref:DUF4214 domain-containing protein n=2 Tax=Sphingomonas glacialis TaxID=658225 RepID=A0A502FQC7_9SPHN|nr:DUF4214 domain-containing protein [Sphingomonas glacialis]
MIPDVPGPDVGVLDLLDLPIPYFVEAAYRIMLGRAPEPSEHTTRIGALRVGLGRERLLSDLVASREYAERWSREERDQTDAAFIERQFRMYAGRGSDPAGLEHYLKVLAKGRSRKNVVRDIAGSAEAAAASTFWRELKLVTDEEARCSRGLGAWLRRIVSANRRSNRQFELFNRHHHRDDRAERRDQNGWRDRTESLVARLALDVPAEGLASAVAAQKSMRGLVEDGPSTSIVAPQLGASGTKSLRRLHSLMAFSQASTGKQDARHH